MIVNVDNISVRCTHSPSQLFWFEGWCPTAHVIMSLHLSDEQQSNDYDCTHFLATPSCDIFNLGFVIFPCPTHYRPSSVNCYIGLFYVCDQYQWILAESPQDPASMKLRKKKTKTILNNFGRKMTVKVGLHF